MEKRHVTGVSGLDVSHHNRKPPVFGGIQLQANIDVSRSPDVCYRYWRDFSNLPSILKHVQSVAIKDQTHSHWMVDGPGDTTAEWDAELIEDIPKERISWRSSQQAQIDNAGSVQFASLDGGRRTRLKVALTYNPPLGPLGNFFGHLFGETPDQELADDLSHFKQVIERGN